MNFIDISTTSSKTNTTMLLGLKNAGKIDVDDYADTNKSRLRDEVKKDLNSNDNSNERLEDAIKAFAIIEMNDAQELSLTAIV